MAKEKPALTPAERVLAQWAQEATHEQPLIPDWDPEFSASFPNLWVFLTWSSVGSMAKSPGSLSLRAEGTGWRLGYHDPSAKRSTAVVAASVMEAFKRLDMALVDPMTVWTSTDRRKKGWTKRPET